MEHKQLSQFAGSTCKPRPVVERRNTRERSRIGVINATYQVLRRFFPAKKSGRRMSKLEILQRTINYINDLQGALDNQLAASPRKIANIDLPKRPRARKCKVAPSDHTISSTTSEEEQAVCGAHVQPQCYAVNGVQLPHHSYMKQDVESSCQYLDCLPSNTGHSVYETVHSPSCSFSSIGSDWTPTARQLDCWYIDSACSSMHFHRQLADLTTPL